MPFIGTQPAETALTGGQIADDVIDSDHYANGSIDTAHIAANQIDGTLTKDALIADYSDVTITAADLVMYGDATDSNNTKRDTVQGILDLAGAPDLLIYTDQAAAGSAAGDSHAASAFRTIVITNEITDSGGHGALSSNQITLAAGTYRVQTSIAARANASSSSNAMLRFYDTTNTTTLVVGTVPNDQSSDQNGFSLFLRGQFTLSGSAACELQVYSDQNISTGTGTVNFGEVNIAAVVYLEKV